jgi:hypothetical protein
MQLKGGRNMKLGTRKLIIVSLVGLVFFSAHLWLVVNWLNDHGVIEWAGRIHTEYLTGTAITIIVVLLILLGGPRARAAGFLRRCPVCDHTIFGRGQYCSDCGCRV